MILANVIQSAFGPLISVFQQILVGVHDVVGGSWGWAIIGLTLIVRIVTLPLTRSQFKGMAQMRLHAPELKKIQERYKDDRVRQQEETMKYYKEVGVQPALRVPAAGAAVPGLHLAGVHAAHGPAEHICSAAQGSGIVGHRRDSPSQHAANTIVAATTAASCSCTTSRPRRRASC